jgi:hypothetical protein
MKLSIFLALTSSLAALLWLAGCGVKGKPLPPLTPPVLGRGEPSYSRATKDVKVHSQMKKEKKSGVQDDWDEEDDFAPNPQK